VRPTVKIGLVAPFEGRYRYVGYDVFYAVRLALHEANEAGGVGARSPRPYSVELVAYDDGGDGAMAVEQARKLAADPQVVAAIGHFREETTGAALSAYAEAGIPLVAPAVLDPALTEEDGAVFRPGPDAGVLAAALLDRITQPLPPDVSSQPLPPDVPSQPLPPDVPSQPLPPDVPSGGLGMTLISDGGPLGQALQDAAGERGVRLAPVVSPDGDGWLEEVLASGADVVICDARCVTAGEVIVALRDAGWEGDFLGGPELAAPDFVAVAGEAAEGVTFVSPTPNPSIRWRRWSGTLPRTERPRGREWRRRSSPPSAMGCSATSPLILTTTGATRRCTGIALVRKVWRSG
jgi:ABC-type branched-subunit amino acid transport system substrate-binding protein